MVILNFILFQIGWFACVYLGANYRGELGALIMAVFTLGQVFVSRQRNLLLCYLVAVTVIGSVLDAGLNHIGIFEFLVPSKMPWSYPIWMSGLWLGFSLVIHRTLGWLSKRFFLSALFGFSGGAVSYYIGGNMGGIAFPEGLIFSLLVIGMFWAIITPFLFWLHEKIGLVHE